MRDKDFADDRASFADIVRHQLSDLESDHTGDRRIEVDTPTARIIDEAVSGLEQQNPCSGFEPLKNKLLRMLWIRDQDQ